MRNVSRGHYFGLNEHYLSSRRHYFVLNIHYLSSRRHYFGLNEHDFVSRRQYFYRNKHYFVPRRHCFGRNEAVYATETTGLGSMSWSILVHLVRTGPNTTACRKRTAAGLASTLALQKDPAATPPFGGIASCGFCGVRYVEASLAAVQRSKPQKPGASPHKVRGFHSSWMLRPY